MSKRFYIGVFLVLLTTLLSGKCAMEEQQANDWRKVPAPEENPTTLEKAALGRDLFFDKRLSIDGTVACASCHDPHKAFTDNLATSTGIRRQKTTRNAPSILNAGFLKTAMFDAHIKTLEMQAIVPIQEPTEMGHNMKELIPQLRAIPAYQEAAKRIYNRDFDAYVLTRSLAAFERTLVSMNSRYDRWSRGEKQALTADEKAGWKLFSEELYCTKCHPAPYFTTFEAANNGLYLEFGEDKGRFRIFKDSADIGKFKIPSLRNIELTFPYMHDGSLSSLDEVLKHYQKGGNKHPLQDKTIVPFSLSDQQKKQLISFLKALTDTSYTKEFIVQK